MSDYKDTLNLPKTAFSMKANLAQREPNFVKKWQDEGLYEQIRAARAGCEKFILHDGPPYANGNIHVGHAVNKSLKDIVIKAKTLSGYDAPYIPGWDCHGLPIELNVEKKFGRAGNKISVPEFREKSREYAAKQVDLQRNDFMRLGILGDWFNPYQTMDYNFEADVIRVLAKIIDNGHLAKGVKPVHWCVDCGSSLAEAEVEYKNKTSNSIYVKFSVEATEQLQKALNTDQADVVIWTTTPWTLPANQAVCVNPEITYCLVKADNQQYILAKDLLESVATATGLGEFEILAECQGSDLENLQLQHPFNERQVPVILGDHVTIDAGTGLVHTAPAHGDDDFKVSKKYGLSVECPVGANGCFFESVDLVGGQFYSKANPIIVEHLTGNGRLLAHNEFEHSYPHCWRHKSPLIFRATPQWFVSMTQNNLRADAESAIKEDVTWSPEWGYERMRLMLEGRPDWCISRQRAWGTPIPLFVHKETGEIHPDSVQLMLKAADLVEEGGLAAWFDSVETDFIDDDNYERINDTLDVWFDSGASNMAVMERRAELEFPADLYLEGSDQYRGWFQTSLLTAIARRGETPYRQVVTHGFVVDGKGHKMSKSIGNTVSPIDVCKKLGADILRLWLASTDYRGEIAVSDEIFKRAADTYRRLRNTAKFLLSNLNGFDPASHILPMDKLLPLDAWAVARTQALQSEIVSAYDAYQFHQVSQKIHHFCIGDMGGFYLDVIKDRQYTCQEDSLARRSAQTAMFHIIHALVRWLAPILSFTADEIWQVIPGEKEDNVFIAHWYEGLDDYPDTHAIAYDDWATVLTVREEVNKVIEQKRADGVLGSSLEAEVTLYAEGDLKALLDKFADELRFVLISSAASVVSGEGGEETGLDGLKVSVSASTNEKCERCWHRLDSVGQDATHPTLCGRCVTNIDGEGEVREFA